MAVTLETEQETLIAVLNGEIDHHCAKEMRSAIDEKIESCQPDVLILDFGGVTFMDSSGIGLIMGRQRRMQEIGGSLIVRNPPAHIRRVMHISGIERIAQIENQPVQ